MCFAKAPVREGPLHPEAGSASLRELRAIRFERFVRERCLQAHKPGVRLPLLRVSYFVTISQVEQSGRLWARHFGRVRSPRPRRGARRLRRPDPVVSAHQTPVCCLGSPGGSIRSRPVVVRTPREPTRPTRQTRDLYDLAPAVALAKTPQRLRSS